MRKSVLIILMSICVITAFALPVSADESTTTYGTAYKTLDPLTGIYAVTDKNGGDYPFYGAKNEPENGVYFGRINDYAGSYVDETLVAYYAHLLSDRDVPRWESIFKDETYDYAKALLLNLNFEKEKDDCTKVVKGEFDTNLNNILKALDSVKSPVFIRIGGEMNIWSEAVTPELFIKAYKYVADMARQNCPNAALVFSPNYSSPYNVDMDDFYPGDDYVDWIGASLYYNRYSGTDDTTRDAFYGVNKYGDPMLNIQQIINLSNLHKKPVIITEGGSACVWKGEELTAFASERVNKAYSFLTMVYPQIKALVYSDSNFNFYDWDYTISGNYDMTAAYNRAKWSNPTLKTSLNDTAQYYTRIHNGSVLSAKKYEFAAYTYDSEKLKATWYLDGKPVYENKEYPYISFINLSNGYHTITVSFSNGAKKTCGIYVGSGVTGFKDVSAKAYYLNSVNWAADKGVTDGTSSFTFGPNEPCTRGQIVTFLWNAAGKPVIDVNNTFKDVKSSDYYYKAVQWAVRKGITSGEDATHFGPANTCTRAQAVSFIYRYAGNPDFTTGNPFKDVKSADYYYKAVLWAVANKITAGTESNVFSPDEACSRAQIVSFLYRCMK